MLAECAWLLQAVTLQNCDVYSYKGDGDLDPLSELLPPC